MGANSWVEHSPPMARKYCPSVIESILFLRRPFRYCLELNRELSGWFLIRMENPASLEWANEDLLTVWCFNVKQNIRVWRPISRRTLHALIKRRVWCCRKYVIRWENSWINVHITNGCSKRENIFTWIKRGKKHNEDEFLCIWWD